jgi:uncharacterized membrane protein
VNIWLGIVIASVAVYSWKFIGHLLPKKVLDHPRVAASANYLTIALMAALVGVQTFVTKSQIVFDARVVAAIVAMILSALRVPFLVIVGSAALIAALIRLWF